MKIVKLYYQSFIRIKGWVITTLFLVFSIVPIYFKWEISIQLKYILPLAFLIIIITTTSLDVSFELWKNNVILPKVVQGKIAPKLFDEYTKKPILLLLSKSQLFNIDSVVSVYELDDNYEKLLGFGRILSIQDNGLIQVLCWNYNEEDDNLWEKASKNDNTILKRLIIKPNIHFQHSNFKGV